MYVISAKNDTIFFFMRWKGIHKYQYDSKGDLSTDQFDKYLNCFRLVLKADALLWKVTFGFVDILSLEYFPSSSELGDAAMFIKSPTTW